MTAQDKATIKTYFNTDDVPTEGNFGDLVDSYADVVHTHGEADITDLQHAIPIYEDGGFLVTGTLINFENDIEVAVTGTFAHISASQSGWHVGARVYDSGDQTIATNTPTAVTFDSERYDTDNIHDNVTNNSRLTATTAGKYLVIALCRWDSNTTGYRQIRIQEGGTTLWAISDAHPVQDAGIATNHICSCIVDLAASDYVEMVVLQTTVGNLDIKAAGNFSNEFMMHRIG